MRSSPWIVGTATVAAIVAAVIACWLATRDSATALELRRLLTEYPAAGRLSVLPDYRVRKQQLRSESRPAGDIALLTVARRAEAAAATRSSLSIRTFAAAQLALGRSEQAVELLKEAAAERPDALIWSDLASAYLTAGGRAATLKAMDAASAAYELNPRLREVRFNYAAALEAIGLSAQARAAWTAYAMADRTSAWSTIARASARHADVPSQPRGDGLEVRREIERRFSEWARQPESTGRLDAACALAGKHHSLYGDAFWPVMCQDARKPQRLALAQGWLEFACGQQAADTLKLTESRRCLTAAARTLQGVSRAGLLATVFQRAIIDSQSGDLASARSAVEAIRAELNDRRFLQLAARAEWMLALANGNRGQHSLALEHFARSRAIWQRINEPENELAVQSLYAGTLRLLGNLHGAWDAHQAVLQQAGHVQHPRRRQGIFLSAGEAAASLGYPRAASRLLDEYVAAAEASGSSIAVAEAHLNRLTAVAAIWTRERREAALSRIEEIAATVDDPGRRAYILAVTALRRAALAPPRDAVALANEATAHAQQSGRLFLVPETRLARARGLVAMADLPAAERELVAGIHEFDRQAGTIAEGSYRVSFRDTGLALYETLVALLIGGGRLDEAFAWFDRARMRTFEGSGIGAGVTARELQAQIPPETSLLAYMSLGDRLAIWHISREAVRLEHSPVSLPDVVRLTNQWRELTEAPRSSEDDLTLVSESLFDALIRPIAPMTSRRVIVIPDWPLHGVPFGALRNRRNGMYLIQSSAIVVTPSASLARGYRSIPVPEALLAIGAPVTDSDSNAFLPRLPEAEREAREISELYPLRQLLIGADATERASLLAIPTVDVAHFATHGVANRDSADLSYLLMARESGTDGRLTAEELRGATWRRASLVILAACGTAVGVESRSEGPMGLSRAILSAGVPRVVATLWDVDDRMSRELLTEFHRAVRSGLDPIEAMQRTQSAVARTRPLRQWSAFIVFATRLGETPRRR